MLSSLNLDFCQKHGMFSLVLKKNFVHLLNSRRNTISPFRNIFPFCLFFNGTENVYSHSLCSAYWLVPRKNWSGVHTETLSMCLLTHKHSIFHGDSFLPLSSSSDYSFRKILDLKDAFLFFFLIIRASWSNLLFCFWIQSCYSFSLW